jgi:hypothetical protein
MVNQQTFGGLPSFDPMQDAHFWRSMERRGEPCEWEEMQVSAHDKVEPLPINFVTSQPNEPILFAVSAFISTFFGTQFGVSRKRRETRITGEK